MNNEVRTISLKGVSINIGMPAHRPIPVPTVISLLNTTRACNAMHIPLEVIIPNGSSVVMTARNQIADAFLRGTATHLFWIDSDIRWSFDQFMRVLAMSTQFDTARAIYPRRQEMIMFDMDGIGFTCVQRKVIQTLANAAPMMFIGEAEPCKAIFRESFVPTERATSVNADVEYFAEDSTFFAEAKAAGFTTWIDPQSNLGHVGEKVYQARLDDRWEVSETDDDAGMQERIDEARRRKLVATEQADAELKASLPTLEDLEKRK